MTLYRKIQKKSKFYFVKGIILDHFRHPKSIFWYRKVEIFMKICKNKFLDQKTIFYIKIDFSIQKNRKKTGKTRKNLEKNRKNLEKLMPHPGGPTIYTGRSHMFSTRRSKTNISGGTVNQVIPPDRNLNCPQLLQR